MLCFIYYASIVRCAYICRLRMLAPLRTDWWRASYQEDKTVPGINKPGNLIEITNTDI